jgi:DNA-binding response OmpR family regulator
MGKEDVAPAGVPPAPLPSLRVLLVEDNEMVARSLAALLRRGGHRVDVAHTGAAALDAAGACPPHLALVDIGLPDMSGFEVATRLRRQEGLCGTLLVALTGQGDDETRRLGEQAGFACVLSKPVNFDRLDLVLSQAAAPPPHHASA